MAGSEMKHKHADLIKAWADGAEIEYLTFTKEWLPIHYPTWRDDFEYRIKPKPKPDEVRYAIASFDKENRGRVSVEPDDCVSILTKHQTDEDNLKLIFDGETLKLKSAEVLK